MKRILLSALALSLSVTSFAQDKKSSDGGELFEKGTKVLTLGIAPVSGLGLPINLGVEFGVTDNIGIGAVAAYASKNYGVTGFDYKVTYMMFGIRGNYHKQFVDNLDTYGGLTLGYNAASVKWPASWGTLPKPSYGGVFWGLHLGGRYYFTPKVAGMLELGASGLGTVNLGVAFKL